jgi:hypothetical protein
LFSLQEGQIMIEGWLEVRHPGDYQAWRSSAASNIYGLESQEAEKCCVECDRPAKSFLAPREAGSLSEHRRNRTVPFLGKFGRVSERRIGAPGFPESVPSFRQTGDWFSSVLGFAHSISSWVVVLPNTNWLFFFPVIRPQSGGAANACTLEEQRLIDLPYLSLLSTTNAQRGALCP